MLLKKLPKTKLERHAFQRFYEQQHSKMENKK